MDLRTVQIFKDNAWVDEDFWNLKTGDRFKMFEPDGTPIQDEGQYFLATSDFYYNSNSVGEIACEPKYI